MRLRGDSGGGVQINPGDSGAVFAPENKQSNFSVGADDFMKCFVLISQLAITFPITGVLPNGFWFAVKDATGLASQGFPHTLTCADAGVFLDGVRINTNILLDVDAGSWIFLLDRTAGTDTWVIL